MNIQLVGGLFNWEGGRRKDLVDKVHDTILESGIDCKVDKINGGKTKHLKMLVELSKLYDVTIWTVDKYTGIENITKNTKLVVIVDNKKELYTKENLRDTIKKYKPTLLIEIKKGKYKNIFTVYGSTGHIWYNGVNIDDCVLYSLEILK